MESRFPAAPSEPTRLHLDILELILQEHRNDRSTLAATALAAPLLLPIARKFLYRSVSLDDCENPYAHEQQRKLRGALAASPHLCGYIRTLRVSLAVGQARGVGGGGHDDEDDVVLSAILRAVRRVESLHVIGGGMEMYYDSESERHRDLISAKDVGRRPVAARGGARGDSLNADAEACSVDEALKRVFALRSLRKVTLENIYPLSDLYMSCFTELKHLELLSVGGEAPLAASSAAVADAEASATPSGPSLSPHLPSHSIPPSPSPDASSSPASSSWPLDLSQLPPQERADRRGTPVQSPDIPSYASSPPAHDRDATPARALSITAPSPAGTSPSVSVLVSVPSSCPEGNQRRWGSMGRGRKVRLEYLVLNLEHLQPVLDVIYQRGDLDTNEKTSASVLDFSALKEAHVYVWNPDDAEGVWTILHAARTSLERLTLRYFHYQDTYAAFHRGFESLHSLVLGTHPFSIADDPFRSLILFFASPSAYSTSAGETPHRRGTKFPALRSVKISFDLWGCESGGARCAEVGGYRGWRDLDAVFAAFDSDGGGEGLGAQRQRQLTSIMFELWCSSSYKLQVGEGRGLVSVIRDELVYLRRHPNFIIV